MRYIDMVKVSGQAIFEECGRIRQFKAGQIIAERGAIADRLFFIQKGQVKALLLNPDGEEITLFYIDSGNMCCTESLVSHPRYIVNIEAVSDVTAYSIEPSVFLQKWTAYGHTIAELLTHFVRRILLLSDYLCCMRFQKSISRVAYFLHTTYSDNHLPISFTRDEIAGLTGTSTITVNRCLKELEDAGVIHCGYHKIKVVDEEKLSEYFSSIGYGLD